MLQKKVYRADGWTATEWQGHQCNVCHSNKAEHSQYLSFFFLLISSSFVGTILRMFWIIKKNCTFANCIPGIELNDSRSLSLLIFSIGSLQSLRGLYCGEWKLCKCFRDLQLIFLNCEGISGVLPRSRWCWAQKPLSLPSPFKKKQVSLWSLTLVTRACDSLVSVKEFLTSRDKSSTKTPVPRGFAS